MPQGLTINQMLEVIPIINFEGYPFPRQNDTVILTVVLSKCNVTNASLVFKVSNTPSE